jgi:ferredoxin
MAMSEARWRVSVDREACVLSGNCAALAAERFELTDDGARPVEEEILPDETVLEAADACPMEAITVVNTPDDTVLAP